MIETPNDPDDEYENNDSEDESVADSPSSCNLNLSFEDARVLGCLLEKQATTPDHYPLTLNALVSACNQSSNREPVVAFESSLVEESMENLRYNGIGILVRQAGARVAKYKHMLEEKLPLTESQNALICVLLLRGQQTSGELRQRTERMRAFNDVSKVEEALDSLIHYDPYPLVKKFPAGGGRRVPSYAHLLSGELAEPSMLEVQIAQASASSIADTVVDTPTWRDTLENRIKELESEVAELKSQLEQLRSDLGA